MDSRDIYVILSNMPQFSRLDIESSRGRFRLTNTSNNKSTFSFYKQDFLGGRESDSLPFTEANMNTIFFGNDWDVLERKEGGVRVKSRGLDKDSEL